MAPIILASASPQRKSLLENIGLSFTVEPSRIQEEECPEHSPRKRAQLLAGLKAHDVAARNPGSWIIGCDTLVVAQDGTLLEKPHDARDATQMLLKLSSALCSVHSAVCLISPTGDAFADISTSIVGFRALSTEDIDWWIASGLWKDRSGSFQIDGPGQLFISRIDGDWTGVVGLPLFLLSELFKRAGQPMLNLLR